MQGRGESWGRASCGVIGLGHQLSQTAVGYVYRLYRSTLSYGSPILSFLGFSGSCITGDGSICDVLTASVGDGRSGLTYAEWCGGGGRFEGVVGAERRPP